MEISDVVGLWNAVAKQFGLPIVRCVTEARRKALMRRLKDNPEETIQEALEHVRRSSFLTGRHKSQTHPGWRCDFDFFISERGFTRILEGKYDDIREATASTLDPDYAIKSKIESFLRTGHWPYGTPKPTDSCCSIPKHILAQYREQFAAKGWELPL